MSEAFGVVRRLEGFLSESVHAHDDEVEIVEVIAFDFGHVADDIGSCCICKEVLVNFDVLAQADQNEEDLGKHVAFFAHFGDSWEPFDQFQVLQFGDVLSVFKHVQEKFTLLEDQLLICGCRQTFGDLIKRPTEINFIPTPLIQRQT